EHFRQINRLDARQAQPLINLGAVYNRKKDYNAAVKTLRQALSKDRRCAEAYYNLGIAYRGQKQLSMAVSAYKEAIRLSPEMAEAYQNLANAYLEMGNTQQAIVHYEQALKIRPDFERARRGLERAMTAADTAKQAISPFGRLVDIQEVENRAARAEARPLSPQERYEDRSTVHKLAKEAEMSAAALLTQLRGELEQRLLRLTHAISHDEDRNLLHRDHLEFIEAREHFDRLVRMLQEKVGQLREHDSQISA
ncbi:MAG: tetratricopeptide repeat protein, partial [Maioricimonas sp. JB049]